MIPNLQSEQRIDVLDGFRALAIIAVILFHYYNCYGGQNGSHDYYEYSPVPAFVYGQYGVPLFFTISGFVIYGSLLKSTSVRNFLGKRYLRLLPAMALCSVITYLISNYWNDSIQMAPLRSENPLNFLSSFTFIHPNIWNAILFRNDINWIDVAYWSLWAEVVFYVAAALVFFYSGKGAFLTSWLRVVLIIQLSRVLTSPRLEGVTPDLLVPAAQTYYKSFLFMEFHQWIFFTIGVFFYALWSKEGIKRSDMIFAAILFVMQLYFIKENAVRMLFVFMIGLWSVFVYRPQWLRFLEWKPILLIGLVSYPLYLLHQNIGLIISNQLVTLTSGFVPPVVVPLFILFLLIAAAWAIFTFYERPVMRRLRTYFIERPAWSAIIRRAK